MANKNYSGFLLFSSIYQHTTSPVLPANAS